MNRFEGRATRTAIPNSWQRTIDWKKQIKLKGEEIEIRVKKKERTLGKKQTFEEGETELIQDLITKKVDTKGMIEKVRVADDGTVSSYDIMIEDLLTSRHRRYIAKLKNASEADSGAENMSRAPMRDGSRQ